MADKVSIPVGLSLATDIEFRPGATDDGDGYRARVRWRDKETGKNRPNRTHSRPKRKRSPGSPNTAPLLRTALIRRRRQKLSPSTGLP
jgi:hypothetical protein